MVGKLSRNQPASNRELSFRFIFWSCLALLFSIISAAILSSHTFAAYPTPGDYSPDECMQLVDNGYDSVKNCVLDSNLTRDEANEIEEEIDKSADDSDDDSTECIFLGNEAVGGGSEPSKNPEDNWGILCLAVPFFSQSIDWSNTQVADLVGIRTVPSESGDVSVSQFITLDGISEIWSGNILPIANIILALVFLIIIYGMATGGSDGRGFISLYNIKKILPRLIVAAVLINVSFYVCQVFNDLVNILAASISNIFGGDLSANITSWKLGDMMQTIGGYVLDGEVSMGLDSGSSLAPLSHVVAVLYCIMCVPVLLASLGLFILLAFRELIIVVLILASPIIFAVSLLPSQSNLTTKYISIFVKLLLIYPAIVAVVILCFQVEANTYNTFLTAGDDYSFLPVIFITVVSLVPFITIRPFYKAYTSLFNKISGQTKDIQTRIATSNNPKTSDNKGNNWLTNAQQRIKAATNQLSGSASTRQRSIKERLEKEAVDKKQTDNRLPKSNSTTSARNANMSDQQSTRIANSTKNQASNITRKRSETARGSTLSRPPNYTGATDSKRTLLISSNESQPSGRNQINPTLTLDRMNNRLRLGVDRTGTGVSGITNSDTLNSFYTPSKASSKNQDPTNVSRQRTISSDKKEPLATTLNTPRFNSDAKPALVQKTQVEANLSQKAERVLTQNQAAINDKLNNSIINQSANAESPTPNYEAQADQQNASTDTIETSLNGGPIVDPTERSIVPKTDNTPPTSSSVLSNPKQSNPTANLKKTLKNIFK